ncbi:MAG: DNA polymerase IV [Steroidobacter sp.]
MTRAILHVDMDAFYASVEQRENPQLKGKPLIVGGTGNRGVVAAASYEVRKYGVHSAMPMRDALRLCPHAICVRPRINFYQSVSKEIFKVFHEYTPLVEGLSLDEAFLDVTHSQSALGPAECIAVSIKQKIRDRTQLTASVGVAPNKLIAKIASDMNKPDGLMIVREHEIHPVLDPLPVSRLFGIGKKTQPRLHALGIHTFGDLRHANQQQLKPIFGKHTTQILARASGVDDRPVIADWDEKQISSETTFDTDIRASAKLHTELTLLADRTAARLRSSNLQTSCVIIKIRRSDFTTYTRQQHVEPPTQESRVIVDTANNLLHGWLSDHENTALRLLGVGVSGLTEAAQLELFTTSQTLRNRELDAAVDRIREKFGAVALTRGDALHQTSRPPRK